MPIESGWNFRWSHNPNCSSTLARQLPSGADMGGESGPLAMVRPVGEATVTVLVRERTAQCSVNWAVALKHPAEPQCWWP